MPSPLDFLHRNNNQDEWAKRYVGNKMGIQQMQDGGSVGMQEVFDVKPDGFNLKFKNPEYASNLPESPYNDVLRKMIEESKAIPLRGLESAPVDETAHDQMNNLIFENEMKQSQGASPFSFLNQDRIDEQNQLIMDAVTGSAGAMGTVTKGVSSLLGSGTVPKQKLRDFIYNKMFKASEHGKGQPFFSRVQSLKKQFESLKNVDDLYVTKGSRRLPAYFKPPGPDWYNPVTKTWKDELVPWSKGSKKFKELADKMIKEAETAHKKYYPEPKPPRQYQHGGAVFESAIPDETAHSQMNELLAQDEIQQMEQSFKQHGSMGVAPISFVGDPGSLDMVSGPFSKAGSLIAPFNKNIFSILAKMAKESKRAEGAKELYKIKKKSEPFFGKITEEDILNYRKSGKTIYGNKLLRKAMKEYNEHRMVRPSTEINLKNLYR